MAEESLFEEGLPLQECLERVQVLFYDESTNSESQPSLKYLNDLLLMLSRQRDVSSSVIKSIASFVRDLATFHPNACHLLLIYLPDLPDPRPFIDIMASMFSVAPPSLVAEAAAQLKLLPEQDSRLLLPVIGAMADLPLSATLLLELHQLAEDAIDRVDEADLPALFRTLLKSLCPFRAEKALLKLRHEMDRISESSVAQLMEVMWEVLPSSPGAAEVLLNEIFRDQQTHSLREPSLTDLAILLILTANFGALKCHARDLLKVWLRQGCFPFAQLELVLSLRRSSEIWERMVPAVWRLCLWTLEAIIDPDSETLGFATFPSATKKNPIITSSNSVTICNREGLTRTVLKLCDSIPSMQETVVSNLLGRCYAGDDSTVNINSNFKTVISSVDIADADRDSGWLLTLPPLGSAAAEYGILSGEGEEDVRGDDKIKSISNTDREVDNITGPRQRQQTLLRAQQSRAAHLKTQAQGQLAAAVLENLVAAHPEIGASVLSSLMDRLTPSSPSQGGRILLPVASILHSLVSCTVSGACSSPQIENTLFIVIQKLLAAAQLSFSLDHEGGDSSLLGILSSLGGISSSSSSGYRWSNTSPNTCRAHFTSYSPGTVSCFLAGHLLLRPFTHALNVTDFGSVLAWVSRAFGCFTDMAMVCATDILVACLEARRVERRRVSAGRQDISSSCSSSSSSSSNSTGHHHKGDSYNARARRQEDGEDIQTNLLLVAAGTCMQRVFKLKGLVDTSSPSDGQRRYSIDPVHEGSFVAAISLFPTPMLSDRRNGRASNASETAAQPSVTWNIFALSKNLISFDVASSHRQRQQSDESLEELRKTAATLATEVFWMVQRTAALHSALTLTSRRDQGLDTINSNGVDNYSHVTDSEPYVSVRLSHYLGLNVTSKHLWTNSNTGSGQVGEKKVYPVVNVTAANAASSEARAGPGRQRGADTERVSSSSSPLSYVETTDDLSSCDSSLLNVWACGASEGIEGLAFTRPLSLSARDALRLAWERGLVAAVLLGSIPLHCASSSNKESTGNHSNGVNIPSSQNIRAQDPQGVQALLVVSRLLCQIHMSRHMLRSAQVSSSPLPSAGSSGSKVGRSSSSDGVRGRKTNMSASGEGRGKGIDADTSHRDRNNYTGISKREHHMLLERAERAAEWEGVVFSVQKRVLQGLLNRMERLIDSHTLLAAVQYLLYIWPPPSSPLTHVLTTEGRGGDIEDRTSVEPRGWESDSINKALLTDAGLALIATFTVRVLAGTADSSGSTANPNPAGRGTEKEMGSAIRRDMDAGELFFTLSELKGTGIDIQHHSLSFSNHVDVNEAPSSSSFGLPQASSRPEISSLTLLCAFLSLFPVLCRLEEQLRRASVAYSPFLSLPPSSNKKGNKKREGMADSAVASNSNGKDRTTISSNRISSVKTSSERKSQSESNERPSGENLSPLDGKLGAPLDRAGCAVLLMTLYSLLDQSVQQARRRAKGDLFDMAVDPCLQAIARGVLQCGKSLNGDEISSGSEDGDEGENENHDEADGESISILRVVHIYSAIEQQTLAVQDVSLAIGGMRLLFSFSEGTMLRRRGASVAWVLLLTIHTQHTDLCPSFLHKGALSDRYREGPGEHIPGTDALWPHLAFYVSPSLSLSPCLPLALSELSSGILTGGKGKASTAAINAFRSALGISSHPSSVSTTRINRQFETPSSVASSISSFRVFWAYWWVAEVPHNRIHGVVSLLSEMFRCHLLPDSPHHIRGTERIRGRGSSKKKVISETMGVSYSSNHAASLLSFPESSACTFPSLTASSLHSHFALALSMFPALFLLARSQSTDIDSSTLFSKKDDGRVESLRASVSFLACPFRPFLDVTQAFIWLLQQLEELLEEEVHMSFILRISAFCVRTTRAVLLSVETAVAAAIVWRNRQSVPISMDNSNADDHVRGGKKRSSKKAQNEHNNNDGSGSDDGSESDKDLNSESETERDTGETSQNPTNDVDPDLDMGSVEHLALLLDWSLALAHRVIRYSESLKGRMLHPRSGLVVPRELSRATPQLQFAAERLAARLLRSAETHSIRLRDPEELFVSCPQANVSDNTGSCSNNGNRGSKEMKTKQKHSVFTHWDSNMKHRATEFSACHQKAILKAPAESSWCAAGAESDNLFEGDEEEGTEGQEKPSKTGGRGSQSKRDEEGGQGEGYLYEGEEDEEAEGDGFVARTKDGGSSRGWGLYEYDEEDEEEDDDEVEGEGGEGSSSEEEEKEEDEVQSYSRKISRSKGDSNSDSNKDSALTDWDVEDGRKKQKKGAGGTKRSFSPSSSEATLTPKSLQAGMFRGISGSAANSYGNTKNSSDPNPNLNPNINPNQQ